MKKYNFKIFKNKTGSLVPFSLKNNVPFNVKRIFIIYGKKNSLRADHAHIRCSQFLVPIFGKVIVKYENKKGKYQKELSFKKERKLIIEAKNLVQSKVYQ